MLNMQSLNALGLSGLNALAGLGGLGMLVGGPAPPPAGQVPAQIPTIQTQQLIGQGQSTAQATQQAQAQQAIAVGQALAAFSKYNSGAGSTSSVAQPKQAGTQNAFSPAALANVLAALQGTPSPGGKTPAAGQTVGSTGGVATTTITTSPMPVTTSNTSTTAASTSVVTPAPVLIGTVAGTNAVGSIANAGSVAAPPLSVSAVVTPAATAATATAPTPLQMPLPVQFQQAQSAAGMNSFLAMFTNAANALRVNNSQPAAAPTAWKPVPIQQSVSQPSMNTVLGTSDKTSTTATTTNGNMNQAQNLNPNIVANILAAAGAGPSTSQRVNVPTATPVGVPMGLMGMNMNMMNMPIGMNLGMMNIAAVGVKGPNGSTQPQYVAVPVPAGMTPAQLQALLAGGVITTAPGPSLGQPQLPVLSNFVGGPTIPAPTTASPPAPKATTSMIVSSPASVATTSSTVPAAPVLVQTNSQPISGGHNVAAQVKPIITPLPLLNLAQPSVQPAPPAALTLPYGKLPTLDSSVSGTGMSGYPSLLNLAPQKVPLVAIDGDLDSEEEEKAKNGQVSVAGSTLAPAIPPVLDSLNSVRLPSSTSVVPTLPIPIVSEPQAAPLPEALKVEVDMDVDKTPVAYEGDEIAAMEAKPMVGEEGIGDNAVGPVKDEVGDEMGGITMTGLAEDSGVDEDEESLTQALSDPGTESDEIDDTSAGITPTWGRGKGKSVPFGAGVGRGGGKVRP
ncbi:hypothetical protein HK097_007513, partial [Rhizophlyctis rosea]